MHPIASCAIQAKPKPWIDSRLRLGLPFCARSHGNRTCSALSRQLPGCRGRGPAVPKWRNWQTHGTQNPAVLSTMRVRPPPSAPMESTSYRCPPSQQDSGPPPTLSETLSVAAELDCLQAQFDRQRPAHLAHNWSCTRLSPRTNSDDKTTSITRLAFTSLLGSGRGFCLGHLRQLSRFGFGLRFWFGSAWRGRRAELLNRTQSIKLD